MANEKRLIDVNKVIDEMQRCIDESPYERDSIAVYAFSAIIECLKQEPTVDAVEAVHGRWELHGNDDNFGCSYFCSNCHNSYDEDWFYVHGQYRHLNYCPNCGAKMDLE